MGEFQFPIINVPDHTPHLVLLYEPYEHVRHHRAALYPNLLLVALAGVFPPFLWFLGKDIIYDIMLAKKQEQRQVQIVIGSNKLMLVIQVLMVRYYQPGKG